MPYAEELRTLAEIAIALAGFTGIFVALERRSGNTSPAAAHARLRELLLTSLGVVFFAFLPSLMAGAIGNSAWAWRGPLLLFAAYHVSLIAIFLHSAGLRGVTFTERLTLLPGMGVVLIQLATAFGFLPDYLHVSYLLALVWTLFIATLNFSVLLLGDEGAAS